jgi:predicted nucleotidyltransferase
VTAAARSGRPARRDSIERVPEATRPDPQARQARLDRIVRDVVARATRAIDPERVWLFGSQATGTSRRGSDVDLAFELRPESRARWAAFVVEASEEVPALVEVDLVDLGACGARLAEEITATGRVVYERRFPVGGMEGR